MCYEQNLNSVELKNRFYFRKFSSENGELEAKRFSIRSNDLLYLVEHLYPLMDLSSDLTSPRVTWTVYYSWPVTKPWIFSLYSTLFFSVLAKAGVAFLRARYFLCLMSSTLFTPRPVAIPILLHLHRLSSPPSRLCLFPVPSFSLLNFKRTITDIQEIVILIFVIFFFSFSITSTIDGTLMRGKDYKDFWIFILRG